MQMCPYIVNITVFDKHHDDNDFNHGEESDKVVKYITVQNNVDNDVDDYDDEDNDDDNGNIRSQFNLFLLGR